MLTKLREAAIVNGKDLATVLVGKQMEFSDYNEISKEKNLKSVAIFRASGHNDHIHIKFTRDTLAAPKPFASDINLALKYSAPPANATPEQIAAA